MKNEGGLVLMRSEEYIFMVKDERGVVIMKDWKDVTEEK